MSGKAAAPVTDELVTADALGNQLIRTLRLLAKARTRLSTLLPGTVEHGAFPIIATLVKEGPHRTSALADVLHTEISTISRQTSALVQLGMIERKADPNDGRACLLAPTDEGRALFERARSERNLWLAGTLRDWDPADANQLIGLLERLNTDFAGSLAPHPQSESTEN